MFSSFVFSINGPVFEEDFNAREDHVLVLAPTKEELDDLSDALNYVFNEEGVIYFYDYLLMSEEAVNLSKLIAFDEVYNHIVVGDYSFDVVSILKGE